MAFEIVRALQIAASLAILIWFRDRILSERSLGWSFILLCASYVVPALFYLSGAGLNLTLQMAGVTGVLQGASLLFLFFSLLELPWAIAWRPEKKPAAGKKTAAKKKSARKKKTSGS
jgi:hypothetical protein